MNNDLPKLSSKQQKFVLFYLTNGNNASEAYRQSYDCKNSSKETIASEASKLLKNPNVTLWLEQAENNTKEVFNEEIKYSIKDCFDELAEVQDRARKDKGNYTQEIKAIELKGKLAGHFIDKHEVKDVGLAELLDKLK